jgi:hypothetical protein
MCVTLAGDHLFEAARCPPPNDNGVPSNDSGVCVPRRCIFARGPVGAEVVTATGVAVDGAIGGAEGLLRRDDGQRAKSGSRSASSISGGTFFGAPTHTKETSPRKQTPPCVFHSPASCHLDSATERGRRLALPARRTTSRILLSGSK